MKKTIVSLILSVSLLICLTACSGPPGPEPTPPAQTIYEKLDSLLNENYQKIELGIVTVTGDVQLSANYVLTQTDVSYSIERLNMLPPNGDIAEASPDYKTTCTGTAKIVDGKVSELDGESITLPSYDELKGNFNFEESNFKNVITQNNSLKADVISPSSLCGSQVDAENMKICVEHTESAISKITITYQTAHATVSVTYEFTK